MSIVQTLFSDSVLAVVRAVVLAATPDSWDWLPSTALAVASIVDDLERIDADGPEKLQAVVDIVVTALDSADDVPGWRDLSEDSRDKLVRGFARVVVFSIRAVQTGGLPDQKYRVEFADALRDLTLAVFDLVDAVPAGSTPPALSALVTDRALVASKLGVALSRR